MKTVLCVPGHDERKVERCREYGADLILFDLEDSVPEDKKDRAREIVAAHVTKDDDVRINNTTELLRFDIEAIIDKCRCVWTPKAESLDGAVTGGVLIVETPRLLLKLLRALSGEAAFIVWPYRGLAFGAADFAAYMNVPASSPQVQYARAQVALAAAALGVPAYDSPCTDDNPIYLANEAKQAAGLGYAWKGVVHPAHIKYVKSASAFNTSLDRQLVDQYERERGEDAVTIINGRLVAPPMIRAARRRLEEADK